MEESQNLMTDDELLELLELENKNKKTFFLKKIIVLIIILCVGTLIYGILVFFPFNYKIEGQWIESETSSYVLNNTGKKTVFKIKNVQNNPGLTLIFKGDLSSSGTNRYKAKNNQPYLEVDKKTVSEQLVRDLKNSKKEYSVESETEEKLLLEYTKVSIKKAFPNSLLDELFYYELTPNYFLGQSNQIKMRNSSFANPTILLNR